MPRTPHRRILAVVPGADALAFALAERDRLLYYGIRTLEPDPERRSETTGERAVAAADAAIDDLSPDALALPKTCGTGARRTRRVHVINDRIRAVGLRRDVKTYRVAPAAARKAVTGDPDASQSEMIEALSSDYPELEAFVRKDSEAPYRDKGDVVGAVALAWAAVRARTSYRATARG